MKTILLSFSPYPFYEPMKDGRKRFEYRSRFGVGEHMAYIYLSNPVQKIVARIKFGERISLEKWKKDFSQDKEAMERLYEFETEGKKYALPILEFQEIEEITLEDIREKVNDFNPPRSYYILENKPELLDYLSGSKLKGEMIKHDVSDLKSEEVCTY